MDRSVLIGAGAVGALVLLEQHGGGRYAGAANKAAAEYLRANAADHGVAFEVPASASMLAAHEAFQRALGTSDHSLPFWIHLEQLWLGAYRAGAAADATNYALIGADSPRNVLENVSVTDIDFACGGDAVTLDDLYSGRTSSSAGWAPEDLTELGRAVCALQGLKLSPVDELERRAVVVAHTRELAAAMDAADYVVAGARRSDRLFQMGSFGDTIRDVVTWPFRALGEGVASTLVTIAMAGVAGFVIWKVATK
jgi:hypothetical protein